MKTNLYEVEVRPSHGGEQFQYYTETVEAHTSNDALKRVQRRNPDCVCRVTDVEYRSDDNPFCDDNDSNINYSDSDSSLGLRGMFGSVIMVGLAIGGIVMFTGGEDSNNYQPATSAPSIQERVQQTFSDITPSKDHPLNFSIRELPKSTPAQYRAEENGCDIWRKAQPALAAQLQPGDKCYR